jgi:hypothetical protein
MSVSRSLLWILIIAVLTLASTFALDAFVFRTGIYTPYLSPQSSTGSFELTLRLEKRRRLKQPVRALVVGDSQMAEGFSARVANSATQRDGIEFANAASPGATMRTSYFLLRDLDPAANRYNMILIGLRDYADVNEEDKTNRATDLNWVIARLRLTDMWSFANSFDEPALKWRALVGGLFKGTILRADVRDFIRHVRQRIAEIHQFDSHGAEWHDGYEGNSGSLAGLSMNTATGEIRFSPGVNAGAQQEIASRLRFPGSSAGGLETIYRKRWLLPIIARYRARGAKIVIYRMPQWPLPLPDKFPAGPEAFVNVVRTIPGVVVLDEHVFDALERPENFFDGVHLNRTGRREFSIRLAQAVASLCNVGRP